MANATYYAHSFSQQLQSLKQRLGTVGPRQGGEGAPESEALELSMSGDLSVSGGR